MSSGQSTPAAVPVGGIWSVPNLLTVSRLVLAVVCFVLLSLHWFGAALVTFIVAAGTDWVDGYWARKYGPITQLGRILDPFADKFIVCGAFIYLAAEPGSMVAPWMAVLVMGREILVTALRSFVEASGGDFSAKWAGKWKMLLQCLVIVLSLWRLRLIDSGDLADAEMWLDRTLLTCVWAAILLTIYSGWGYIRAAFGMARR